MRKIRESWTKVSTVAALLCCCLGILYGYFDQRPIQFYCNPTCEHLGWHDGQRIGCFKINFSDSRNSETVLHPDSQGFVNYAEQRNYIIQRQWKTDASDAAERKAKEDYLRNVRAIQEPW